MRATRVLYALLGTVAAAAAVLSFTALRDLAERCGFVPSLSWLLPVVVDAGAAAGAVAWLARQAGAGRAFGRALALVLLVVSVAGNALGHALAAYSTRPHWAVVVAVSAVAPAVLGAVSHLAVLVARPSPAAGDGRATAGETARQVVAEPVTVDQPEPADPPAPPVAPDMPGDDSPAVDSQGADRVADLIAAGAGRRRIAAELRISEHEARVLIDRARNGHSA